MPKLICTFIASSLLFLFSRGLGVFVFVGFHVVMILAYLLVSTNAIDCPETHEVSCYLLSGM